MAVWAVLNPKYHLSFKFYSKWPEFFSDRQLFRSKTFQHWFLLLLNWCCHICCLISTHRLYTEYTLFVHFNSHLHISLHSPDLVWCVTMNGDGPVSTTVCLWHFLKSFTKTQWILIALHFIASLPVSQTNLLHKWDRKAHSCEYKRNILMKVVVLFLPKGCTKLVSCAVICCVPLSLT